MDDGICTGEEFKKVGNRVFEIGRGVKPERTEGQRHAEKRAYGVSFRAYVRDYEVLPAFFKFSYCGVKSVHQDISGRLKSASLL
jgi:hypothetical protein